MADEAGSGQDNENGSGSQETDFKAEIEKLQVKLELEKKHRKNAESKEKETSKSALELTQRLEQIEQERQKQEVGAEKFEDLKKSFDAKTAERIAEVETKWSSENESLKKHLQKLTVDAAASDLAAKLFGDKAQALAHHVRSELTSDFTGESPQTIVLNDGKPSADSLDDLYTRLYNRQDLKPFVVSSQASGGGANGSSAKGSSANPTDPRKMNTTQQAQWANKNPEEARKFYASS